jgi:Carboxypeptidase regulatory-like domain
MNVDRARRGVRLFVIPLLFLLARPAFSQISTGAITGRALDNSGALIPGVEVTITSPAMIGGGRSAPTDELGVYRFTLLPIGVYRVSFALPGFKTLNIESVNVAAGATMTINGTMDVATVAEEVTVTSQAPQIDLEAASVGVNWGSANLDKLPWGKGIRGLSQMIPGIYTPYYDVGGNTLAGATTVSGRTYGRTGNEIMQFEGAISNDSLFGDFGTYAEVQYSAAAKGAEGQNAGVTVSFTIKSGGNDFHGSVVGSYQPGRFQSNNVDQELLSRGYIPGINKYTHYDDWSGELGGPILKNRLTFYTAFSHNYAGQFIPGFISEKTGQQAEFFTRLDTPTLKLTYQMNNAMKLELTEQIGRKWQPYRRASAFVPLEATQNQKSWGAIGPVLKWTDIINPRMTVDASINRAGYWWPDVPWTRDIRKTDLTTTQTRGEYQVTSRRPIRWGWNATWSWFTDMGGKNNEIKTGVNGHWDKAFTETSGYPDSYQQVYRYRSTAAEAAAGQYFLHPDSVQTFDYPNTVASGVNYNSWFVNDKITWNRKLTFNVGIRIDHYSSWLPEQGNPGTGPWSVKKIYPERRDFPEYNAWSPRFSFVYDLKGDGKVALKASYGRYTGSGAGNANGPVASNVNPAATTTCTYNNWDGSIPYQPIATNLSGSCSGGGGIRVLDPKLDNYWTDEYTAGIELGLSRNALVRFNAVRKMDYGGSKTLNLAQPFSAYTDVRSGIDPGRDNKVGTADDGVVYVWSVPRTYATFGQQNSFITNRDKNEGNSLYTGYETSFNKQFADKWSFLAGYTFSYRKVGVNLAQNPNELFYNRIAPAWDQAFKMNGTYDLPLGIRYASTFQAQTGDWYPRTVQIRNALNSTVSVQVENQVGRYQWVKLWDNRISKTIKINDRNSLEGTLDVFNTGNINTVVSQVTSQIAGGTKVDYGFPVAGSGIDASAASSIIAPRILRFGVRWRF